MKYEVILNGKKYEVEVEEGKAILLSEQAYTPAAAPAAVPAAPAAAPAAPAAAPAGAGKAVEAPMPGNILAVKVSNGQAVKAGDVLIILEAMKMENEICAPSDGTVSAISVNVGQTVDSGTPLVYLA